MAHPSGDPSNSDAGCHVIPPQSDRTILLAHGCGGNCTTVRDWSGCALADDRRTVTLQFEAALLSAVPNAAR
jgi:hypothetical protein